MAADRITGVAWDHRRCWGPLDADALRLRDSGALEVDWRRRSLFSFGEGDLEPFVDANDLIVFDHPFTGDIARRDLMLDLSEFLTPQDITVFEQNQVGGSFRSYRFEGGLYGLPLDAAATTAAWRPDLMQAHGFEVPVSLDDVMALARAARGVGKWIAWAAKPTDLLCAYIAMIASQGFDVGRGADAFTPKDLSEETVARLKELRRVIHPKSFTWNPIQLFDHMTTRDDVLYTPYAFNYVNYACLDARPLSFGPPPRLSDKIRPRGLLGGAGIGISTRCKSPETAFRYAMRLVAPEFQAGDYVVDGGQPGMRSAWVSPDCDRITNGFFSSCLQAMDDAYLRPNLPGFVDFFHEATLRLAAVVSEEETHADYWAWQTKTYDRMRADHKAAAE